MNSKITHISKSVVVQKLEDELKINQQKYAYHKRIADGYFGLIQQTLQKLEGFENAN